ncbi:hypothetical protein F2Q65_15885 [Thiohalocapsa marina]|uniref:Thioredoxin domain-containing protein n=1 Tax=Thiohalocapsa marina TaxID=424902 RepID=A0A5M8FEW5_9GAMM|nr:hypothetical protein [Thiohalocapsa marina]KAA6183428.1 hypothetical protein F2Q65_15885 [Thiohalocapsa marina]
MPRLIMAVAAVGLFLIGYQWGNQYQHGRSEPPRISGVLIRPPQPLPEVRLTDSAGRTAGEEALRGAWSLLAFAPLDSAAGHLGISKQIEVFNRLADRPQLREQLQLRLLDTGPASGVVPGTTPDRAPERTPALAQDFERLTPAIAILAGEPTEIEALRAAVGASDLSADQFVNRAAADTTPGSDPASAAPTPAFFLIEPRGRLVALFPAEQTAAAIADDIRTLADRADDADDWISDRNPDQTNAPPTSEPGR